MGLKGDLFMEEKNIKNDNSTLDEINKYYDKITTYSRIHAILIALIILIFLSMEFGKTGYYFSSLFDYLIVFYILFLFIKIIRVHKFMLMISLLNSDNNYIICDNCSRFKELKKPCRNCNSTNEDEFDTPEQKVDKYEYLKKSKKKCITSLIIFLIVHFAILVGFYFLCVSPSTSHYDPNAIAWLLIFGIIAHVCINAFEIITTFIKYRTISSMMDKLKD